MDSNLKDFKVLREARDNLSSFILRVSLIRLLLLTIIVSTFISGYEQTNNTYLDIQQKRDSALRELREIEQKYQSYGSRPDVVPSSRTPMAPTPAATPNGLPSSAAQTEPTETTIETMNLERAKILAEIDSLRNEINRLDRQPIPWKISLLGTDVPIDLKAGIYALPLLFLLTELYLQILRKKAKLLSIVGASTFRDSIKPTKFDQLLFSKNRSRTTPYARYPSQLEKWVFSIYVLCLAAYLFISPTRPWGSWNRWTWGRYLHMFFTLTYYVIFYYFYSASELEAQVSTLTKWRPRQRRIILSWRRVIGQIYQVVVNLKPRRLLISGSICVLLTLYFPTVASCGNGKPLPDAAVGKQGYELILGRQNVWWYSAVYLEYWDKVAQLLGRYSYILCITFAAFTLCFMLISIKRPQSLQNRRLTVCLFYLATCFLLFVITDFAFSVFWYPDKLFPLRIIVWIGPMMLWLRYIFSRRSKLRRKWPRTRMLLVVLFLPLVINACGLLAVAWILKIWGLPIYFVGVNLLTLGYMLLSKRQRPVAGL